MMIFLAKQRTDNFSSSLQRYILQQKPLTSHYYLPAKDSKEHGSMVDRLLKDYGFVWKTLQVFPESIFPFPFHAKLRVIATPRTIPTSCHRRGDEIDLFF